MSTDNFFIFLKYTLFVSGLSVNGAIVINPCILTCGNFAISRINSSVSCEVIPNLLSSCAIFTSIKTLAISSAFANSFSICSANLKESTEWINWTFPTRYLTLFLWRCPIICHLIFLGKISNLSQSSCTLFSP